MLIARKKIYHGRVIEVVHDDVELPNGQRGMFEVVRHPGGAAIVALDTARRVCLLRQFRHAADGWVWELPAGKLEPDEPPALTAERELQEEAGVRAQRWRSLGSILSSPGVFNEVIHLYLAEDLTPVPIQHEVHEAIEVHWVFLADAAARAASGEINDAKTVIGLIRADVLLRGA